MPKRAKRAAAGRPVGTGKFDAERQEVFLDHLAKSARWYESAAKVDVHYSTVRGLVVTDPAFEQRTKDALEVYRERIEKEIDRRAIEGWLEPRYNAAGRAVGAVRLFSDRLLLAHARRHIPDYREKLEVAQQISGKIEVPVDLRMLSTEARQAMRLVINEQVKIAGIKAAGMVRNGGPAPEED